MSRFIEITDGELINIDVIARIVPSRQSDPTRPRFPGRIRFWNLYDAQGSIIGHTDATFDPASLTVIIVPAAPGEIVALCWYDAGSPDQVIIDQRQVIAWRIALDGLVQAITPENNPIDENAAEFVAYRSPDGKWFAPEDTAVDTIDGLKEVTRQRHAAKALREQSLAKALKE